MYRRRRKPQVSCAGLGCQEPYCRLFVVNGLYFCSRACLEKALANETRQKIHGNYRDNDQTYRERRHF